MLPCTSHITHHTSRITHHSHTLHPPPPSPTPPPAPPPSVTSPSTTFPLGMLLSVILVLLNYLIPLMTGVLASTHSQGLGGCGPCVAPFSFRCSLEFCHTCFVCSNCFTPASFVHETGTPRDGRARGSGLQLSVRSNSAIWAPATHLLQPRRVSAPGANGRIGKRAICLLLLTSSAATCCSGP